LGLLVEAKIVSGVFGDHPAIHERLAIPIQFPQLLKQISSVSFTLLQQAIRPLFDDQHPSRFSLNIHIFVQVDHMAFVPFVLELLHSEFEVIDRVSFVHGFSDDLHAFVVLGLVAESYRE
jgi:hypothetical protein